MKEIENYKKACETISQKFAKKYFGKNAYFYWVGDEVGGCFYVNDFYFSVEKMVTALENNATLEQLVDYYNAELEISMMDKKPREPLFNFKNYLLYPNNFYINWEGGDLKYGVR